MYDHVSSETKTGYVLWLSYTILCSKDYCIQFSDHYQNPEQYTPPKINIEPENDGLEDVSPFPGVYSQVPC